MFVCFKQIQTVMNFINKLQKKNIKVALFEMYVYFLPTTDDINNIATLLTPWLIRYCSMREQYRSDVSFVLIRYCLCVLYLIIGLLYRPTNIN